jgi:tRNA1Val (adenine37-N6)-methyltransferase
MARKVFELLHGVDLAGKRVLDLCAGCGIVGLDFLFHRQNAGMSLPLRCDFLEIQECYEPFFRANAGNIETETHFITANYSSLLQGKAKYDLILCNPPYFREGQGAYSPNQFKNRCRFYLDSDFATLIQSMANSLNPKGRAFLLLRDLSAHGVDVAQELRHILGRPFAVAGDIRGTALAMISDDDCRPHPNSSIKL